MNFEFPIEALDRALGHKNIILVRPSLPKDSFDRTRTFTVFGKKYTITWFVNGCRLEHEGLEIPFQSVAQKGTWPNDAKMNLQFYDRGLEVCCVLPIEYYDRTTTN